MRNGLCPQHFADIAAQLKHHIGILAHYGVVFEQQKMLILIHDGCIEANKPLADGLCIVNAIAMLRFVITVEHPEVINLVWVTRIIGYRHAPQSQVTLLHLPTVIFFPFQHKHHLLYLLPLQFVHIQVLRIVKSFIAV